MEAVNNIPSEVLASLKKSIQGVAEKFVFTFDNTDSRQAYKQMMHDSLVSILPEDATNIKVDSCNRRIRVTSTLMHQGQVTDNNPFEFASLIPYLTDLDDGVYGIYVHTGGEWSRLFNAKYIESTEVGVVGYSCEISCVSSQFEEIRCQLGFSYPIKFTDSGYGYYSLTSKGGCIDITDMDNGTWYINRLFVRPEHRNKGYATAMMRELIQQAKNHEVILMLEVNPYGDLDFDQLVNFYEKFGFSWNNEHNAMYR